MIAIVYTRVSTEDQADYGTGLETQKIECAQFADRISATVAAAHSDPGVSGTQYPRPGIEAALSAIEAGLAEALIVHRVDRLGRKLHIPPTIFERIKAARGRLFTVEDGEVTDENILMFSLRCGMAQTDYNRIVQNMKAGKRRLAEQGKMPTRCYAPYGYRIIQKIESGQVRDDAGTYVIEPAAADVVRMIFNHYAAGESLGAICKELQLSCVPTPRAETSPRGRSIWQPTVVSRILKNTAYKGYVLWGKTVTIYKPKTELSFDELLNCRTPTGKKKVVSTTPEQTQVRLEVPAIVSAELWEECQRKREQNLEVGGIRNDRKNLFASLVICPNCGRRMNSAHVNYPGRTTEQRPVIYRCRDHAPSQNSAGIVCHRQVYKESDVFTAIRTFFSVLVDTPEFVTAAYSAYLASLNAGEPAEDTNQIAKQLRELEKRERATVEGYTRAIQLGTRQEIFEEILASIANERRALEARQSAAASKPASAHLNLSPECAAEIAASYAADIIEVLDAETLSSPEKNTCLRRIIREIRPCNDGFQISSHPMTQVHIHEAPVTGIVMPVR